MWFLYQSVLGGIDVSRRILVRTMDITPEVQTHQMLLETDQQRQLALTMMNLMPGAIIVSMDGDTALIHVLDSRIQITEKWVELQRRIAAAAGEPR